MGARRLALAFVVWLCVVVGSCAFAGAPAGAAVVHEFLPGVSAKLSEGVPAQGPLNEPVPLPGPLNGVNSMSVDAGELYVAEGLPGGGSRLDKFNASSGAFVAQFSQAPSLSSLYQGVAVGHSTGEGQVYVAGNGENGPGRGRVAVFGTAGALLGTWTGADTPSGGFGCFECVGHGDIAVDESGSLSWAAGDVYVADPANAAVDVFKPKAGGGEEYVATLTGTEPGVPFVYPSSVAVNQSNDEVLIAQGSDVDIFRPAAIPGQYEIVRALTGTPSGLFGTISGVTVDGGNGDIYVSDTRSRVVDQFDAAGAYLGQLTGTPAGPFGNMGGVAVDPISHHVYVGESKLETQVGAIDVYGENLVVPDALTGEPSNVQPGSVTLNGTVNPDAIQVSDCHFEYGTSSAYGQSAPCVPAAASIPADSSAHAVSADVTGLTPGRVYHFRLVAGNTNGTNNGLDRIFGPPAIDEQSSANPAQTAATLQAQINPEGVDTTCHFEYVDAAHYNAAAANPYSSGSTAPCNPADLGAATGDQAASAELGGLRAGVTYHWRVVAVNAAGTANGGDQSFTTVPPARIDSVTITDVAASSATLHAQINPLGTDTTYRFQYGTDTTYGSGSIPVPDADIGSGSGDVTVTQRLTGLQANTTYHVRVVASNALGTERSADHTFVYDTTGAGLPDNRAYEMVTPPRKNAALIGAELFSVGPAVSEAGSRVILTSIQCFAGAGSCTGSRLEEGEPYAFTRTSGGWVTSPMAPPAVLGSNSYVGVDANTGGALFSIATPPFGEDDFYARRPDGSFVDVGPAGPPSDAVGRNAFYSVIETADLSHVLYRTSSYEGRWPFDATSGLSTLYEYVGAGNAQPVLVGVSGGVGSTDLISACDTIAGAPFPFSMSADGRVVYFTAARCPSGSGVNAGVPVPADALYARIDGSRTVAISQRSPLDCSGVCLSSPAGDTRFEGASADGSRVFFTDTQQLTDTASEDSSTDTAHACHAAAGVNGCNLYEYDFANPTGHNVLAVSAGDTSGGGPRVQGVVGIAQDGSHVYFVAKGVLTGAASGSGQVARDGANNLYVFERDAAYPAGRVAFIAALPTSDTNEVGGYEANVTPDGRFLVFTSHGALTPDDSSVTGVAQVFRYDALRGELVRVSIGENGFNDNGNAGVGDASIRRAFFGSTGTSPPRSDPTMSHDGSFVFFQSPVALTAGALNDVPIGLQVNGLPEYAQNVYEYHDGHVYLISDGRDAAHLGGNSAVQLMGSDASGANVFFTTADRLVGQDTDTQVDYYDARVCTASDPCVSSPPEGVAACQGEACHGTPGASPVFGAPGSAVFSGAGNLTSPGAKPVAKAKKKIRPRKKARGRRKRTGRGKKGRGAARSGGHVKRGRS